jgi:hypothetical protein
MSKQTPVRQGFRCVARFVRGSRRVRLGVGGDLELGEEASDPLF